MSALTIGLGIARLSFDIADMRNYVSLSLEQENSTIILVSRVALKTLLFLGHIFEVYEAIARKCGWKLSIYSVVWVRSIMFFLSLSDALSEKKAPFLRRCVSITDVIFEFSATGAAIWESRLLLSDEKIAALTRYKTLVNSEWVSPTKLVYTYKLLTRDKINTFIEYYKTGAIFSNFGNIYYNFFRSIMKILAHPNKREEF
jgi:hypothetical protein